MAENVSLPSYIQGIVEKGEDLGNIDNHSLCKFKKIISIMKIILLRVILESGIKLRIKLIDYVDLFQEIQ